MPIADARPSADATDAHLARQVRLFLSANRASCSRISVRVEEGTVRLSGSVRSFFLRQTAIALAKQLAGVRYVVDDLEVDLEEIGARSEAEP